LADAVRKASFLDRLIIEFAPDILVLPVVQNRREEERRVVDGKPA